MKCLLCARDGRPADAVALCRHCQAGLCLGHLTEAAGDHGPGGTRMTCSHDTWVDPFANHR